MDKKILDIDKLKYLDKPVTMGLRINPQTKLTLAAEASKNGVTLSEFVLKLITNKIELSNQRIESLKESIYHKEKLLLQYETPYLKQLFEKEKGNKYKYQDKIKLTDKMVEINQLTDMYVLILNSFEKYD
jgi:hypothetical protein